jgi:GT2 family glycosyltransferase
MKTIATLMTCHNRKEKTLNCLEALYKNTLPNGYSLEVSLVDDGSIDGTAQAVSENYPQVNIIKGNGNLYWCRGMYKAWQSAAQTKDYDYYLWLNDDTYVFPNTLTVMLSAADATENKAIIVAASCSEKTGTLTYSGFLANGKRITPADCLVQAYTFNGNCVLISKFVYQQIGYIDPLFRHAIGDLDYGLRAVQKGIKSLIAPGFLAYCESHDTLPQWCLKSVSLKKRVKSLYSPLGSSHPYYFFRFELRHFGLLVAIKHLFSIHLRLLSPPLWAKLKSTY